MNYLYSQHDGYGLELNCNPLGVNVLWSDGSLSWYSSDLKQQKNYQVNGQRSCNSNDPNVAFTISDTGVICSVDCRQDKPNILTKPSNHLTETAIASFDIGLAVSFKTHIKCFDIRNMKVVCTINEAHCDDIVDVAFWRGLLVSASQDNLCCVIDYTQGNNGILETINVGKPLGLLGVASNKYLTIVSDDNAFVIYNGETSTLECQIDDLRTITSIGDETPSTILKGCVIDNKIGTATSFDSGKLVLSTWLGTNSFLSRSEAHYHSALVRDYEVINDIVYSTGEDGKIFVYNINTTPRQQGQTPYQSKVTSSLRERGERRTNRMSED
ncbi:hypothetical protein EDI_341890 [Entamoeba dispar SAW760]|uniref:Uncharacterized protein n=1 Tax=Entamoeba dispar (strain ATCC PRA-260 / SAW760) TaxID=370354 RepID=B0E9M1_ENTDS|nr:uncharacterized protein EDI_341890 [Entamoeba dispar SAW760]EDR28739.1 hypothetical protein EDI_341890 [Entamoeba dispar SAW760]|eukprot:EDR28739.1 hypothetical protein EDI_341890 [Entamoeba dispar SAW760]